MSSILDYNNPFAALAAKMPAVRLTLPPAWFFKFPPAPFPQTIPSPPDHPTLAHPFTISDNLYNALLDGQVPFTFAIVYITAITGLNSLNKRRNYEPWAFSKTRLFQLLVILHNIVLAVYSAWTFVGMLNALQSSVYNPYHEWGVAGTVDSLCKLNGPRGFGSAAVYNERNAAWSIANRFFHLGADGLAPDATDVGRIWNEGLAFYGWLFYLSKFYEVIDTLIIISKGKKSSFLQTYHHAGAMICMWAGIRYMSPPIWMFVLVNSFIHSIMYSFYLCTALGIRIPVWFKRTLTTLQITQFVVGATYAFIHLFIEYQSPHSIATHHVPGSPVEDIVSDISSVVSTATATVTANLSAHIKKALLRAAGREGLAENVLNEQGRTFGTDAEKAVKNLYKRQLTEYRDELQWTHCLGTSGQAFAIYLNVLYLLPLTVLFVRFFIKSYLRRLERRRSSTTVPVPIERRAHDLRESFSDATKGARRSVLSLGGPQEGDEDTDNAIDDTEFEEQVAEAREAVKQETGKAWRNLNESANQASRTASAKIQKAKRNAGPAAQNVKEKVEEVAESTSQTIGNIPTEVNKAVSGSNEGMNHTLETVKHRADSVKAQTEPILREGLDKAEGAYETVKTSIVETKDNLVGDSNIAEKIDTSQVQETVENVKEKASDSVQQGVEVLQNSAESVSQSVQSTASSVKDSVASQVDSLTTKSDRSRSAESPSSSQAESNSKSTEHAQPAQGKSDTQKPAKTDREAEKGEETEQDSEKVEDKEVEHESSKEQVRDSDPQESSQTESGIGDAKEDSTSTVNTKSQDAKSKDVAATKKSNKKDVNVKDTNDKKHAGQNVSSQESPNEKSNTKEDIDEKDPTENTDAIEEKSEGRQSFYKGERAEALEKLKSANSESSDQVIPDNNVVEGEKKKSKKSKSQQQKSTADKKGSKGNQDTYEETRSNALEKLESANSEAKDENEEESRSVKEHNDEPSEHAKKEAAEELADNDDSQIYDEQKESWIDVGDDHSAEQKDSKLYSTDASKAGTEQPSFAEVVKSDDTESAAEAGDELNVQTEKNDKQEASTHTQESSSQRQETSSFEKRTVTEAKDEQETTETKQESKNESSGQISSEPEWFERLTTSTDSPKKSNESFKSESKHTEESAEIVKGVSFADAIKEHAGKQQPKPATDGDHGFGIFDDLDESKDDIPAVKESKVDKKEKAEQDKIIAESEPVRDEVKDETADVPTSPRWHRRRKG